jgi:DNA modification methylase
MLASKSLNIEHEKTCDCPSNKLNCLTAKEWIKDQIGVWHEDFEDKELQRMFEFYYEARDIRDKTVHPAVFPLSLAKKVIQLFTHRGELVLDPFVGVGTTLLAAKDLKRNAVGFDINKKYIDICKERLSEGTLIEVAKQTPILDDARNIGDYVEPQTVRLVFTSPPYANLLNRPRLNKSRRGDLRENHQFLKVEQYSQDKNDLGILEIVQYSEALKEIYSKIIPLMKPKAHCVINIPDVWSNAVPGGKRIPMHIHVYNALTEAGFELRNTIIWDRNNIVNKIGIFGWPSNFITMGTTFEYLLDFWKPA